MATISLNADKISAMPFLILDAGMKVTNYKSELESLRRKVIAIDSGVCDVQDVISSISTTTQTQQQKADSLTTISKKIKGFVSDVVTIDQDASDAINKSKWDFYEKYEYLNPEYEEEEKKGLRGLVESVYEWCKEKWEEIKEFDFFNMVGRIIHCEGFRNFVADVVGLAYKLGVITKLKELSTKATRKALAKKKNPDKDIEFDLSEKLLLGFYSNVLSAEIGDDGAYHMKTDCMQQYAQYTTGYDDVFRAAINQASGGEITVAVHQSEIFWVDLDGDNIVDEGEEFIIWSWKGDYLGLGAGTETGIYQVMDGDKDENGEYIKNGDEYQYLYAEVNKDYSVDMDLTLTRKSDNKLLVDYHPDEYQWWITGFNPLVQNVKADELEAVTTIDFSSFGENKDLMLNAFREKNDGKHEWDIPDADSGNYVVTLTW